MILPIYAYGQPVLKKVATAIAPEYPDLLKLIENMWLTMYESNGVGLAAPQIGLSIRLFLIDTTQLDDDETKGRKNFVGIKKAFINAQIVEEKGAFWSYEEGCLSIPNIRGEVQRKSTILLRYLDENFEPREETFDGMNARVIQHEYDHIEGKLFIEHLTPVKRSLVRTKLEKIRLGKIQTEYKMRFLPKS